jgi:hypothetical protein
VFRLNTALRSSVKCRIRGISEVVKLSVQARNDRARKSSTNPTPIE